MSYTPVHTDATNVSAYTIARLNATSPSSGAVASDQSIAIADSQLGVFGYQGQDRNLFSAGTTSSSTYADMPGSSITFSASVAKTYVAHVDFVWFRASGTGYGIFRVVANATTGSDTPIVPTTSSVNQGPFHLMLPFAASSGSNTIKLQWKNSDGSSVLQVDASLTFRHWVISG